MVRTANSKTLALQKDIVYGPVRSRRLGPSLGINLLPTKYKLCPFDCVYCQYGITMAHTYDVIPHKKDFPTPEQVATAVGDVLRKGVSADYLTFSGNGEPTLHPRFGAIVDKIIAVGKELLASADTCILSNSAFVWQPKIRQALAKLDVRIMKLDVGDAESFAKINRPVEGIMFEKIIAGLKDLDNYYVQTIFFDGAISNIGEGQLDRWMERVRELKPAGVQIYTIDRPVPSKGLKKVSDERLAEIAAMLKARAGIPAGVYAPAKFGEHGDA